MNPHNNSMRFVLISTTSQILWHSETLKAPFNSPLFTVFICGCFFSPLSLKRTSYYVSSEGQVSNFSLEKENPMLYTEVTFQTSQIIHWLSWLYNSKFQKSFVLCYVLFALRKNKNPFVCLYIVGAQ